MHLTRWARLRPGLLSGWLVLWSGCTGTPPPDVGVILVLDGETHPVTELERYFAVHLLPPGPEETLDLPQTDEVKSRLFDTFIDEQLLVQEARRRQLSVSDHDIEAYLSLGNTSEDTVISGPNWREAEQRLLVMLLTEQYLDRLPPLTEEGIEKFLAQQENQAEPARRLRLRSLVFNTTEEAERVYQQIRRKRISFEEAVVAHGINPGQGISLEVAWDHLESSHQEALEGLREGQVSPPVELHGETFLFELESWLDDPESRHAWATTRVRRELEGRRRRKSVTLLLEGLRERVEVEIRLDQLPFSYLP